MTVALLNNLTLITYGGIIQRLSIVYCARRGALSQQGVRGELGIVVAWKWSSSIKDFRKYFLSLHIQINKNALCRNEVRFDLRSAPRLSDFLVHWVEVHKKSRENRFFLVANTVCMYWSCNSNQVIRQSSGPNPNTS